MPYPIEKKLVVGVASSALFALSESDLIFSTKGEEEYKAYQERNIDNVLERGVAFPFIKRLLNINDVFPEIMPVEVVLFSKNSLETGLRIFRSIRHYKLDITRAAFTSGKSPYQYIPAFNISLFLSANKNDIDQAINAGYAGGLVIASEISDNLNDKQLRVAFDFDGVIADDESEAVFTKTDLKGFQDYEIENSHIPHKLGPLGDLFKKLSLMQKMEDHKLKNDSSYEQILRIIIVTSRNAPAHERVVTTLKNMGVSPDEAFFLGGMEKSRVLNILKPHIFFDDQLSHLNSSVENIPMVHIPFGIANKEKPVTPRPTGLCDGEFVVPDDFDEPLPEDILSTFEGR
ncbi:5'-nucleotidase [Synechococcus sp. PCC 7502]|uniref:5'-nucleotidase n=1 Tax=Synechococcus sp. PCC 7502 TaxID=1173263 RepID=UPI00029FE1BB|nr:5'-nucleotidase [Synechococcus sp. PCC 7502]AFY74424.1 5'-nucleotidase [Synechococcus sp. PCC 7502]